MSVSTALGAALSGLRVTQAQLDVLATNVANVDTPGYTRKELSQVAALAGGSAMGVRTEVLDRQLDALLQRQIRAELGATGLTGTLAGYHERLDTLMGIPGSASAFDTLVSNFAVSLEALGDNPASFTAQQAVLSDAQVLAQSLNRLSANVQSMRTEAEQGIAASVNAINEALQRIETAEADIRNAGGGTVPADLLDERDRAIDDLAREIDIQVLPRDDGSIGIFTTSGVSLYDGTAARLDFDAAGALNAGSVWTSDPATRSVGTVTIGIGNNAIDLLASGSIRSGNLAGYVQLRDEVLPQMQERLDEFASQMALAMSTRSQGSAPLDPAVVGFDGLQIDLAGIQPGNQVSLSVDDTVAGTSSAITLVHVTDPTMLPLPQSATTNPDDIVIGVDLTDPAAVTAALATAGFGLTASPGAGGALQIVDDGAAGQFDVTGLSARLSVTDLQSGDPALPLFTDGPQNTAFYTGSFDGMNQRTGFAGRIQVNSAVAGDPTLLTRMAAGTASGDTTRADFLSASFTELQVTVSSATGLGTPGKPLSMSLAQFAREIVNLTGREASNAARAREGQELVTNGLLARQSAESGVNIDAEMARLTELQSIYAANAQVMSVARQMMEQLLAI